MKTDEIEKRRKKNLLHVPISNHEIEFFNLLIFIAFTILVTFESLVIIP